jgi:hypothetical protein
VNPILKNLHRYQDGWLEQITDKNGNSLEILLAGTDAGPDPATLAFAEEILVRTDEIIKKGIDYLSHFICPSHYNCNGTWEAFGFQFGIDQLLPNAEFTIQCGLTDDIYGLWAVGYNCHTGDSLDAEPFAFTRIQY